MKIRKATVKDLKRIAELYSVEYSKSPYNGKWPRERALKEVKDYYKKLKIYVAILKSEVVGFIIFKIYEGDREKKLYINEFVVDSKFQGKGFGKALIKFVEGHAKKRKIKQVTLMSNTRSKAFKIYKKLGWKEERDFVSMFKKLK